MTKITSNYILLIFCILILIITIILISLTIIHSRIEKIEYILGLSPQAPPNSEPNYHLECLEYESIERPMTGEMVNICVKKLLVKNEVKP